MLNVPPVQLPLMAIVLGEPDTPNDEAGKVTVKTAVPVAAMEPIDKGVPVPVTEPIFTEVSVTFCAAEFPAFATTIVATTLLLASRESTSLEIRFTAVVGEYGYTSTVRFCWAGEPTALVAVIATLRPPTSAVDGVPEMVSVPVARPRLFKLLAWRLAGNPMVLKYMPLPCEGLEGAVELAAIVWEERLGYPVAETSTEAG